MFMLACNVSSFITLTCLTLLWIVLCEIIEMPRVTMDENSDSMMKKRPGGLICRLEPDNTQWIVQFPRSVQLIRNAGWYPFCERLQGYNIQVTRAFKKNYRDGVVDFKSLRVTVDEESIAEAIGVPT